MTGVFDWFNLSVGYDGSVLIGLICLWRMTGVFDWFILSVVLRPSLDYSAVKPIYFDTYVIRFLVLSDVSFMPF